MLNAATAFADVRKQLLSGDPSIIGENYELGREVYTSRCASCHDTGVNRAPQMTVLGNLRPGAIYNALTEGVMRAMASGLSEAQRIAVAEYLTLRKMVRDSPMQGANTCDATHAGFDRALPPAHVGWGLDYANSHSVSTEKAGIGRSDVERLKLKWAFGFPGATRVRSQPSLAAGAIYIGSQDGYVYALDRETGCERWRFEASAEVRTAVVIEPWQAGDPAANPLAFFADQAGNAYSVRAFTGELVWKRRMDAHPASVITATPSLYNGKLYVPVSSVEESAAAEADYPCCTFRGSVIALEAATGKEIWRTYTVGEPQEQEGDGDRTVFGPSGVAVWNTPAIDQKRGWLYVATGDNYSEPATELSDALLALDLETGAIVWHHQATEGDAWNVGCYVNGENCPDNEGPDFDFGAGLILARTGSGRDLVLAGQKSGIAYGFDAATGEEIWQRRLGRGGIGGGILFGMAAADGRLFVPVTDFGELPGTEFPASPGLYALDIATGDLLWSAPSTDTCPPDRQGCLPGIAGAISATHDLVLVDADDGHLRIYATDTGKILLDRDLHRPFETVNGVAAMGGATGAGAAPIVDGGQLILASGYGPAMKLPGNVLLVYEAK